MTVPTINQGSLALATANADAFSNIAGGNLAQGSQITSYYPSGVTDLGGGRIAGFLGDSITNGSGSSNAFYAFPRQTIATLSALKLSYASSVFAGVAGETSASIALRLAGVLAQGPSIMFILAGTNDAGNSVSLDTYATNMTAMIRACRRAAVPVYVGTVPPFGSSGATATKRKLIDSYNHWLRTVGVVLGANVVDVYTALVDTTSGDMLAAYDSGDGTHPNNLGHRHIALAFVAKLLSAYNQTGLVQSVSAYNLVANPLMVGAGTQPTNYFEQPGGTGSVPTYSILSDSSGFLEAGRWAQMAFNAAAGGSRIFACGLAGTGWAVGDTVAITGKVQITDTGGNWESINTTLLTSQLSMKVTNQSGVNISGDANLGSSGYLTGGVYNIGPNFYPFVIPAGTTSMNLWNLVTLPTGANISVRWGALGVINLTTLGLSALLT